MKIFFVVIFVSFLEFDTGLLGARLVLTLQLVGFRNEHLALITRVRMVSTMTQTKMLTFGIWCRAVKLLEFV